MMSANDYLKRKSKLKTISRKSLTLWLVSARLRLLPATWNCDIKLLLTLVWQRVLRTSSAQTVDREASRLLKTRNRERRSSTFATCSSSTSRLSTHSTRERSKIKSSKSWEPSRESYSRRWRPPLSRQRRSKIWLGFGWTIRRRTSWRKAQCPFSTRKMPKGLKISS